MLGKRMILFEIYNEINYKGTIVSQNALNIGTLKKSFNLLNSMGKIKSSIYYMMFTHNICSNVYNINMVYTFLNRSFLYTFKIILFNYYYKLF